MALPSGSMARGRPPGATHADSEESTASSPGNTAAPLSASRRGSAIGYKHHAEVSLGACGGNAGANDDSGQHFGTDELLAVGHWGRGSLGWRLGVRVGEERSGVEAFQSREDHGR